MRRFGVFSALTAAAGLAAGLGLLAACSHEGPQKIAGGPEIPDRPDYNWDVRPILSQNCFACHGNGKQRAGLRLDLEKAAYGDLPEDKGKHAFVPGNPGKSEAFKRITSGDASYRMPPEETHKVLSAREVAILERWIKQGAKYKEHWAYIPPKEARPERTEWDRGAVNPIDRYVYAGLKKAKLSPSPEADRETLINRVTLDLTGLPPTLKEVDAFVADKDPNAYEHLVDRLLSSRQYAERQANIWMDTARYADSDGYLNDNEGRFQHPYRDWVITAFQRNLPYDKFVTWQVAGDKLPNATREQVLATAFLRAGKKSNEGGIIDEEYRVEYVNERAELMGKAFLGLTVGCAKCHDHKYDVISQADYYSMGGFFNSIDERGIHSQGGRATPMGPTQSWPTPREAKALDAAHKVTVAREAAYHTVLEQARKAAAPKVEAAIRSPDQRAAFIQHGLDADLQAYYPLDDSYQASFEPLMIEPTNSFGNGAPRKASAAAAGKIIKAKAVVAPAAKPPVKPIGPPPDPDAPRVAATELRQAIADEVAKGLQIGNGIAILKRQLMVGLKAEDLAWTKAGVAGEGPGYINHVTFVPGAKGRALQLNDSVIATDKSVGQFERTQPYTLDVWVKLKAGKKYEETTLLYNSGGRGGPGYELDLEDNHLVYNITHSAPYNMISVSSVKPLPTGKWLHLTSTYDGNSKAAGAKLYLDGQPLPTEIQRDRLTRTAKPSGGNSQLGSWYGLSFGKTFGRVEFKEGAVDEFRVFTRALTPVEVAYLHNPASARTAGADVMKTQLAEVAAEDDPRVMAAWEGLRQAREAEQKVETPIYQMMVTADAPVIRKTYILDHGVYNQYKDEVPVQALPRVYKWDAKLPRNRLGLAQWMFDPKHPLTSRVYVNRMWQSHFGTGIVETVEDFGTQGSNPTNPELLDWLAIEFVRSGWDMRHMNKLMVMSATYRQSSVIRRDLLEKDPRNFLLARGPRYRMPAEMIRDNALFASGLLVDKPGGESVFPYQPEGVWDSTGVGVHIYPTNVPDDQMHRRTLYTFMKRNALFPSLMVFDMADRNTAQVVRKISNTPLQALVLLNDPQYIEAYRKLAERALLSTPDQDRQIVDMFRLATRRRPTEGEMAALKSYRVAEAARLAKAPEEVSKLLAIGVAPTNASLDQVQLAAMTMMTAAVMNTPDAYSLR